MAPFNKAKPRAPARATHQGGPAAPKEEPLAHLARVLNAHMLWEDTFYIDGQSSADILRQAVIDAAAVDPAGTTTLIVRGRTEMKLRHAPLFAAVAFAKIKGNPGHGRAVITGVIERADEITEVLSLAGGKKGMNHAIRKGVSDAFANFDEYQFGKYRAEGKGITLRDAVFLTHPNPVTVPLVQKIVDGTLATPDTWETNLSAGADKKATFERLLTENKLGAMALLRNLRGMAEAGVCSKLIAAALGKANWARVLPFRFISALQNAPQFATDLDQAFRKAVSGSVYLPGATAVLVDTSGSMSATLSARSTVRRMSAGMALGSAINGDHVDLYEWADRARMVPNFRSLSTVLGMGDGKVGHGTDIEAAMRLAQSTRKYDRIIVISDMQFADRMLTGLKPDQKGYAINTAPYDRFGVMTGGNWTHFTGFSEATLKYIAATESVVPVKVDEEV